MKRSINLDCLQSNVITKDQKTLLLQPRMAETIDYDAILDLNNGILNFSWAAHDQIIEGHTPWNHLQPYPFMAKTHVEYPIDGQCWVVQHQ